MITNMPQTLKFILVTTLVIMLGAFSTPVIWGSDIFPFGLDKDSRGVPQDYGDYDGGGDFDAGDMDDGGGDMDDGGGDMDDGGGMDDGGIEKFKMKRH